MALPTFMYEGQLIYSPKYDDVFKAVLLEDDRTLMASFLSNALNLDVDADGIKVQNSAIPKKYIKDKCLFLDVLVGLKDGRQVNVEMQVEDEKNMGKRSMYNLARVMAGDLESGASYKKLRPLIALNILDFKYIKDEDSAGYQNCFRMKNVETDAEMPDAMYFNDIYVELPKLPKVWGSGLRELWYRFLSVRTGEELDMIAERSPVMELAKNTLVRKCKQNDAYYAELFHEKHVRDRISREERLVEEALAKANTETAKKMIAEGFNNAIIEKMTGLTVEQITRLRV